ncbi:hypothetical protein OB919_07835 [Halobacteria archaeon AArc-curdl1]|uniref:DUF1102 domain-containing protein n=1 Tax=Natronosalvus hydrolyticus TaxID=2979988 RepID=A0AAP2Z710_9EURY|nr:hypothetical protein [Halobacteria archaeon AArc-curdl1]
MRANRRNVLIGLGTIVAGGGAALGTGAFSTVEAQRTVNVNIIDETDLAEEFVDVIFNADKYESVDTEEEVDTVDGGDGISLVANDVTLVFGTEDNELPPNVTITYNDLFDIVNDDDGNSTKFEVSFDVTGADSDFTFTPDSPTVPASNNETVSLDLETAGVNDSGTLEITITEQ